MNMEPKEPSPWIILVKSLKKSPEYMLTDSMYRTFLSEKSISMCFLIVKRKISGVNTKSDTSSIFSAGYYCLPSVYQQLPPAS